MLDRIVIVREGGARITTTIVGPLDAASAIDLVASYDGQERVLCEVRVLVSPHAHGEAREAAKAAPKRSEGGLWKCPHSKTYLQACVACDLDPSIPQSWKSTAA